MTGKQLCEKLGIDRQALKAWLGEGLPWRGTERRRRFDAAEVTAWLLSTGKAEAAAVDAAPTEQIVLRTRGDVAELFGVSIRTVATWLREGMPGNPGPPGKQEGYFPVYEIEQWLRRRGAAPSAAGEDPVRLEDAGVKRARRKLLELELAEKQLELVKADEILRHWIRAIYEAKAQADQLPSWVVKRLPESVGVEFRRRMRRALKRRVREMCRTLELAMRAQADELDKPAEANGSSNNIIAEPSPASGS